MKYPIICIYQNRFQSKGSISSNSFSYAKYPSRHARHQTISEHDENNEEDKSSSHHHHYEHKSLDYDNPIKSELRVNPSDDNNVVTLTHTVSFYRRQQTQVI